MDLCSDVEIIGWTFRNSPMYHVNLYDVLNVFIFNITVHVDMEGQAALLDSFGHLSTGEGEIPKGIPTLPLNTD